MNPVWGDFFPVHSGSAGILGNLALFGLFWTIVARDKPSDSQLIWILVSVGFVSACGVRLGYFLAR